MLCIAFGRPRYLPQQSAAFQSFWVASRLHLSVKMVTSMCLFVVSALACLSAVSFAQQSDHLVVLSHGLHGSRNDLTYLSDLLEKDGCLVLRSSANEMLNSHAGVVSGGSKLSDEVWNFLFMHSGVKKISFVGNSLGGLYARHALKELFDEPTGLMATLQPHHFLVRPFLSYHARRVCTDILSTM